MFSLLEDEPCIEDENIYTEAENLTLRKKLESHSRPNVKRSTADKVLEEQNCIDDEKIFKSRYTTKVTDSDSKNIIIRCSHCFKSHFPHPQFCKFILLKQKQTSK